MCQSTVKGRALSPSATGSSPVGGLGPALALFLLLSFFLVLQSFLPLGTAIKIGADEDFELSKVTLVQKGYKLYTEVWNDQPPLYTFLLRHLTKNGSPNVLGPRLLTVLFSLILLSSFFLSVLLLSSSWSPSITQSSSDIAEQSCPPRHNRYPLITASLATLLLICSPGFIELSFFVFQEIPA